MKIATSILAILVLFLSTQCVYMYEHAETGTACAKKTCCLKKKACKKEEKEKKEDGCKEAGNPFMACCGYAYILPEKIVSPFSALISLSVKTGFKKDLFISNYKADCWHPPEIV